MNMKATYADPAVFTASPWSVDVSGALRRGSVTGVIERAELGSAGISSVVLDDPLGTLGRVGAWSTAKGAWSAATAYVPGDMVSLDGASWVCILANTALMPMDPHYRTAMVGTVPVSYWRVGEATPATMPAADVMGANVGTYVNAPTSVAGLLTGDGDTAVMLNGTTQYMKVPLSASLDIAGSVSVAGWVNASSLATNEGVLVENFQATVSNAGYGINLMTNGSVQFFVRAVGSFTNLLSATGLVVVGTRAFIAFSYDGTTGVLAYRVNGTTGSANVGTGKLAAYGGSRAGMYVGIGARVSSGSLHLAGTPDDPAVWNRAVTPAEIAGLNAVGTGTVVWERIGSDFDGILGLKQIWVDETNCPAGNQRIYTGFIADRKYRRGTDSLITGVARKIDVTLVDANEILTERILHLGFGADPAQPCNRPAETDFERIAWLLITGYVRAVFDLGLVASTGPVNMDACNYEGQKPADIMNDCSQQSGRNHFIYFDEATATYGLFYDFNNAAVYSSSLRISNVLADVDNVTTFAPEPGAELTRDPSRVSAGVYMPFSGGTTYQELLPTAVTYAFRDAAAPSSNVTTLTNANVRADRYLAENATEEDRITCTVKLPKAKVTGIKAGHRILAKFSHLPGMTSYTWCRILTRTVKQDELTPESYKVELEMDPVPGYYSCPAGGVYGVDPPAIDSLGGMFLEPGGLNVPPFKPGPGPYTLGFTPPATLPTVIVASSGIATYGTPNSGGTWGLASGVYAGSLSASWKFDRGPGILIPICTMTLSPTPSWAGDAGVDSFMDGSDDGTTWTRIIDHATLTAHAVPGTSEPVATFSPFLNYRYWRWTWQAVGHGTAALGGNTFSQLALFEAAP